MAEVGSPPLAAIEPKFLLHTTKQQAAKAAAHSAAETLTARRETERSRGEAKEGEETEEEELGLQDEVRMRIRSSLSASPANMFWCSRRQASSSPLEDCSRSWAAYTEGPRDSRWITGAKHSLNKEEVSC